MQPACQKFEKLAVARQSALPRTAWSNRRSSQSRTASVTALHDRLHISIS